MKSEQIIESIKDHYYRHCKLSFQAKDYGGDIQENLKQRSIVYKDILTGIDVSVSDMERIELNARGATVG